MKVNVHDNKLVVGNTVIEFSNHEEALNAIAIWLEIWESNQKELPKVAANSHSIERALLITKPGGAIAPGDVREIAKQLFQAARQAGRVNNGK